MGDAKKGKTQKKSFMKGVKAEFKKIIWPDKKTLAKESAAVVVISIILGLIITVVDFIIKYGIDFIVK